MARITKAMLEVENNTLVNKITNISRQLTMIQDENNSLRNIIKIYQGMSSLTIATERVTDALTQTITLINRRV